MTDAPPGTASAAIPDDVMAAAKAALAEGTAEAVALAILAHRDGAARGPRLNPWVKREDLERMVAALNAFRAHEWWFRADNETGGGSLLAPVVMQNMLLQIDAGTHVPTVRQMRNALVTALTHYSARIGVDPSRHLG
jgi:hypothetical protein